MKKYFLIALISSTLMTICISLDWNSEIENSNISSQIFYNKLKYCQNSNYSGNSYIMQNFDFQIGDPPGEGICKICAWSAWCTDKCGSVLPD